MQVIVISKNEKMKIIISFPIISLLLCLFSESFGCKFCYSDECTEQAHCIRGKTPPEGNVGTIRDLMLDGIDFTPIHNALREPVLHASENILKFMRGLPKGKKETAKSGEREKKYEEVLPNFCAGALSFYFKDQPAPVHVYVKKRHVRQVVLEANPILEEKGNEDLLNEATIAFCGKMVLDDDDIFPFMSNPPVSVIIKSVSVPAEARVICGVMTKAAEDATIALYRTYYTNTLMPAVGKAMNLTGTNIIALRTKDSEKILFYFLSYMSLLTELRDEAICTALSKLAVPLAEDAFLEIVGVVPQIHTLRDMCTGCLHATSICICLGRYSKTPVPVFSYRLSALIEDYHGGRLLSRMKPRISSIVSSSAPYGGEHCSSDNSKTATRVSFWLSNVNQYFYPPADLLTECHRLGLRELAGYTEEIYKRKLQERVKLVLYPLFRINKIMGKPIEALPLGEMVKMILSHTLDHYEL